MADKKISMDAIKQITSAYLRDVGVGSVAAPTRTDVSSTSSVQSSESTAITDSVQISSQALEVSHYSKLAKSAVDAVDPSKVESFKAAVENGTYPGEKAVQGFIRLLGGAIQNQTTATSSLV